MPGSGGLALKIPGVVVKRAWVIPCLWHLAGGLCQKGPLLAWEEPYLHSQQVRSCTTIRSNVPTLER